MSVASENQSTNALLGLISLLLTVILGLIGWFGVGMKGDLDKVVDAERATSDAVKALQVEVIKETSNLGRKMDAISIRLEGINSTLAERPRGNP